MSVLSTSLITQGQRVNSRTNIFSRIQVTIQIQYQDMIQQVSEQQVPISTQRLVITPLVLQQQMPNA